MCLNRTYWQMKLTSQPGSSSMGFIYEERLSDSPFVETVIRGRTDGAGSTVRPAESHWHMVLVRYRGTVQQLVVGPLSGPGLLTYPDGVELLWIKFKLGTFMAHLPLGNCLNQETSLPGAASNSFWLKGSAWQFPDFENADTFVNQLAHQEILVRDPLIDAVLQAQPHELAPRTVRHRFLQATGLTQTNIRQIDRAFRAAALLRQGLTILDTVWEAGYFDQPHLTRSLKQWVGQTPVQLLRAGQPG
jgi:AraC-like DNA-binding protein